MTKDDFIKVYDPRNFFNYTTDENRCHNGNAPTLRECVKQFGRAATHQVMRPYLDYFFGFVSAQHKPTNSQRDTICWLTMQNYGNMKISEWLLFFTKAMAGDFGKFYNTIDPLDIMTAVRSWSQRCEAIKAETKERMAQAEREALRDTWILSEEDRIANLARVNDIIIRLSRKGLRHS